MSLNRVSLMGRLTRDPELRTTTTGINCATFCLAVDRDYGAKDNGSREADFLDVVAWRQTAEFAARHLTKGRMIVVDGRIQTRNYTDKDGKNRKAVEIVPDRIYFADSKRDDTRSNQNTFQPAEPTGFAEMDDDGGNLPF